MSVDKEQFQDKQTEFIDNVINKLCLRKKMFNFYLRINIKYFTLWL